MSLRVYLTCHGRCSATIVSVFAFVCTVRLVKKNVSQRMSVHLAARMVSMDAVTDVASCTSQLAQGSPVLHFVSIILNVYLLKLFRGVVFEPISHQRRIW